MRLARRLLPVPLRHPGGWDALAGKVVGDLLVPPAANVQPENLPDDLRLLRRYVRRSLLPGAALLGAGDLHDPLHHLVEEAAALCVRRPVVDLLAHPAADHKAAVFQGPEVVGQGGAGHIHQGGQVDHALLAVAQQPEQAQAGGVVQLLEQVRHRLEVLDPAELPLQREGVPPLAVAVGQADLVHGARSLPWFAQTEILFAHSAGNGPGALTCAPDGIILRP